VSFRHYFGLLPVAEKKTAHQAVNTCARIPPLLLIALGISCRRIGISLATRRRKTLITVGFAGLIGLGTSFLWLQHKRFEEKLTFFNSTLSDTAGRVCIGLDQKGIPMVWSAPNCPPNHAIIGEDDLGSRRKDGPGENVPVLGNCCPLPFDDILTEKHYYSVTSACPENSLVTGASRADCQRHCSVRCTEINTSKYKLGPERRSYYWHRTWRFNKAGGSWLESMRFNDIPVAIRYSMSRETQKQWDIDGCVGVPFGSPLTRKETGRCSGFFHRQLLYLDGTPVPMVPRCLDVSDPYDPNATCVTETTP